LEILLPAGEAVLAAGSDGEVMEMRNRLRLTLALISGHVTDEAVRALWFRSAKGRELSRLAAIQGDSAGNPGQSPANLGDEDLAILRLLTEGYTNLEIAEAIGGQEETVNRRLLDLYAKIGVSSRANATTAALLGGLI
jgi:DNA-binding NarL/FixJ family response regulator